MLILVLYIFIFLLAVNLLNSNFYIADLHWTLRNWLCLVDISNEVVSDVLFIDELLVEFQVFDLFESRPCFWVLAKHFDAEVLEVLWASSTADLAPVLCEISFLHHVVEVFIWLCFSEGKNSLNQNEEDHSSWENINLRAIIALPLLNLRCHIRFSSEILS